MSAQAYQLIAILVYFAGMIAIGFWANRKNNDLDDYLLGGRGLTPGVAALSAGASDMSGWLLMGLPGALYVGGLFQAWMAIGLTVGAWINWKLVAPRLRAYTEVSNNSITLPSFFDNRLRGADPGISRALRVVAGLIILTFFTFYVSSGMVAGGTFFQASFGSVFEGATPEQSYLYGMLIVGGITVLYTLFGGFLGATFTDVAQGLLMLAALLVVPIVGIIELGGPADVYNAIVAAKPDAFSLVAGGTFIGALSAAAWGLGYFGQPHIIVRFMALRSPADAKAGRRIGIGWMVLTVVGAIATAFVGLAYFATHPGAKLTDAKSAESVFLDLSQIFFHPIVAGFVLAAVLAAIMSTISSQLVVSSSALVEDLASMVLKRTLSPKAQVWLGRAGVLVVAIIAMILAGDPASSILKLVAFAWAGFGAAFGPVVLLALFWRKLTAWGALSGMVVGAVTVFWWSKLGTEIYEIIPGFIAATLVAVVVSTVTYKANAETEREFDEATRLAASGAKA
ncbi:sodium/proline symporter PutP [Falsarthrobacter nasiphocae]|uniref:Sodium/proline symporter n=1 Tax=Falsarthrobacter nasiphocae TaxID=189863 RepID=A0AAE3YF17_9MICC|nr:sodium/proline symporter PutP [Falsarthrobacter nasiphocae]MDR6891512.1 sodium/proline symporter [Falsarthrobacter nasiphocae]